MSASNEATQVQPLHNPSQAAKVQVPQAPLGPSLAAKALLAKKFAKSHNPTYISPTDNLLTPCSQKLNAAKKKHFTKPTKPVQLFTPSEDVKANEGEEPSDKVSKSPTEMEVDEENPF